MDGSISAHSVCNKLLLNEILQELDLFLPAQLYGQPPPTNSRARRLSFAVSVSSHGVPQGFPDPATLRGAVAGRKTCRHPRPCLRV